MMKQSGEKQKKNRRHAAGFALLLAAALLFGSVPALASSDTSSGDSSMGGSTGSAVRQIDLNRTDGSITLNMDYTVDGARKPMTGGTVSLYMVAPVISENGYHFDPSAGDFADVSIQDLDNVYDMTKSELDEANPDLAKGLADAAADSSNGITADASVKIVNGEASFTGLKPGLYLIVQTEAANDGLTINPFLMSIPDDEGSYAITADPKPSVPGVSGDEDKSSGGKTPNKPNTTAKDKKIPQTGQLWWPVPFIAGAGVILLTTGGLMRRRSKKSIS